MDAMFDLGIEWVRYQPPADFDRRGHHTVWFSCGCCAVAGDGLPPALLFCERYAGNGKLASPTCVHCWSMVHTAGAPPARVAEIVAAMRRLDEGWCPADSSA